MYLKDVEIFCEVATRRSFSKAAEAHRMSQSSASHAVSTIERRLGKQLIDRSKRPLELTPAGHIYFEGCREMLRNFRAIEERVQETEHCVSGIVRVAAIYSVGLLEMDAQIRQFEESFPEVDVELEYRHPDEVYEAVRQGQAHLGLVSFPRDGGEFSAIPWQDQVMVLAVSPSHRLAGAGAVSIGEIAGEDLVNFDTGLAVRRHIDRWLRSVGVSVNMVHAFDNIENVKRAVEISAGVALLPEPTITREVSLGSLVAISISDADWARPMGIVHRRNKHLSEAAQKFVEMLRRGEESLLAGSRLPEPADAIPI